MLTIMLFLVISALITTVAAGTGHCPLWVPVLLLCIVEALRVIPLH